MVTYWSTSNRDPVPAIHVCEILTDCLASTGERKLQINSIYYHHCCVQVTEVQRFRNSPLHVGDASLQFCAFADGMFIAMKALLVAVLGVLYSPLCFCELAR